MDSVIAQSDRSYLDALKAYQRALKQRNALLKYFAANRTFQADTLELYDAQLAEWAPVLFAARTRFAAQFGPKLQEAYEQISGGREQVGLHYASALAEQSMAQLLADRLPKDRVLQYTSSGPHREDLEFSLHGHPLQRVGSQGQQKSFLIALKLAAFEVLHQTIGRKPILLLDDVFDKLDAQRVEGLIRMVNDQRFGQIFVSDTHPERTASLLKALDQESMVHDLTPIS
jgi:DNA replication and repair protein RecF